MKIELDELEARARAATPGPWRVHEDGYSWRSVRSLGDETRAPVATASVAYNAQARLDAVYIAAASPDVVLALIAEVRAAREAAAQRHNDEINDACDDRGPREWRS